MSEVALILGGAIVKTACKIWLADQSFAETATDSLADALVGKVDDAIDREDVGNKLAAFKVTVAKRVVSYIGHEFRGLPPNEQEAAVRAVADTFAGARLTDATLFEGDLDPLYLERHIRDAMPGMDRDLGEAGRGLYARLLPEACAYVITVTTTLPTFGPNAFTELLRRDTVIIERLDEILRRLPAQRGEAGTADTSAAFTTAYLRRAAEKWDQLRLFGTDAMTRRYPLSVAYLSLNVGPERDSAADGPEPKRRRVEDALADTNRMLIRGLAGSGKTTLLHWLAVRAACGDFPPALAAWNELIPFFVPLRAYVSGELPGPEELVARTGPRLPDQAPTGWAARVLDEGRGLVLVDGVDELPAERREAARLWLSRLIEDFPDSRYVVTSRTTGADAGWLKGETFETAALEPMRPYDIHAFIAHWHAAVRSETADAEECERLVGAEERLQTIVFQDQHLRVLASTPLLCALICALHRDWQAALPRERMELYDAALTMLLGRRDAERGVSGDELRLSHSDKIDLLQDLAYWQLDNGWPDAEQSRALEQVGRSLRQHHRISASPEEVFYHLLGRSGLLQTPSAGRVSFVHRTFEEYLAARAIVDQDKISALVDKAHDDQWREVVAMAARHATRARREELIRGLLDRAKAEGPGHGLLKFTGGTPEAQARILITALACLEAAPQLDVDLRMRLQDQTTGEIIPPRTDEHVRALASAGEFALELLDEANHQPSDDQAVRIIEVAKRVGGPRALSLIARLSQRPGPHGHSEWSERFRSNVAKAAVAAWPEFDLDEYAKRVIVPAPFSWELEMTDPALLPGLTHLKSRLTKLVFDSSDRMLLPSRYTVDADLVHIAQVVRLLHLELLNLGYDVDISPIGGLRRLNTLALSAVHSAALRHLAGLHALQTLKIALWDEAATQDFSPLLGLLRLRTLHLLGRGPYDVSSLADAPRLRILADPECEVTGESALGPGATLERRG